MVTSSSSGPIIAVLGATGAQGGSVISHLIRSDKPYQLRAITRDVSKPAAQALARQGVELGADVVFGVTDFWSTMSLDKEITDGKRIVDAVKKSKVGLFLWSGLQDVTKVTGGKIKGVEHFDSKAQITAYTQSSGVPTTVVAPGCYATNFLPPSSHLAPHKLADGRIVLSLPVPASTVISLPDPKTDYGAYVREALEAPQYAGQPGKEIFAASTELTLNQMVKDLNEVTGLNVTFEQVSPEDWIATFGEHGRKAGEELYEMLRWFVEYGYYGGKDIGPSQQGLAVPVSSWKDFVERQKWDALV